jgi:hypothetical protein
MAIVEEAIEDHSPVEPASAGSPVHPGGRYWIVPVVLAGFITLRLLRRGSRPSE